MLRPLSQLVTAVLTGDQASSSRALLMRVDQFFYGVIGLSLCGALGAKLRNCHFLATIKTVPMG
jgi:hypothetical protein